MREIRTSGLTSGNRKRSHVSPDCGGGTKVSPTTSRTATTTAPVLDSTHLDAAVVKEGDQAGPVPQRVAHGLRQLGAAGKARHLFLEPDMQGIHDRPTSGMAHFAPTLGRGGADLGLDLVETGDTGQQLGRHRRFGRGVELVEGTAHVHPAERQAHRAVGALACQSLEPGIAVHLEHAVELGQMRRRADCLAVLGTDGGDGRVGRAAPGRSWPRFRSRSEWNASGGRSSTA
jgi:hypothetical protein